MDPSGTISICGPETSAHTVAAEFDLNETPPPSREETLGANGDGFPADHRPGSCGEKKGKMVVCDMCIRPFDVDYLGGREEEGGWICANCLMECDRDKWSPRTSAAGSDDLELLDMNASPPREAEEGVSAYSEPASDPKMQDLCVNNHVGVTLTDGFPSTNASCSTVEIARLNLDIAMQKAYEVYLQTLKDYISERRGVLGDGWRVRFEYSERICRLSPFYCSPDGSKFNSMPEVAHHLGLLSPYSSIETNDKGSCFALLQNGSHANKNVDDASRSPRADIIREHNSMPQSRVSNGGNAAEVDPWENGNHGSELSLDGLPVQFEDFYVISVGKIDPRLPFHNSCQIWPIGYRSIWHDKLTGSILVCNVLDAGDCFPIFRVNRYPCTKQPIPNASTVLCRPKSGPSDEEDMAGSDDSAVNGSGDVIGEFMVEGRSPSSAWQMVLETLLCACRQAFQDLSVVRFCCNHHNGPRQQVDASYGIYSLDKFSCLTGPINLPNLILTRDQLDDCCMLLRRWLQPDRFGLDAEFVQELIEQLPGVAACSEYRSLDTRCQNVVGSRFFTVVRKYHPQPVISDSLTKNYKRPAPPGNIIASDLPPDLLGDVLQAHEFWLRFHKVLGQEAPISREKLEYELLNPWVDLTSHEYLNSPFTDTKAQYGDYAEGSEADGFQSGGAMKYRGLSLMNFHMQLVKVLVEDMLAKVMICDLSGAMESKSRKGRKKNVDFTVSSKKMKLGIFPVNEITWPELARRYIVAMLSFDGNFEASDVTNRESAEVFYCLSGDGGPLCSSLTGMAAVEADAVVLAEASQKVFSSVKSKIDFIIDKEDLDLSISADQRRRMDNRCPEWIKILEPVRRLPTNVGARIRNRVFAALKKRPPAWAEQMLLHSISKDVYKGNASGPTKKIVVSVLEHVKDENPLTRKKAKESRAVRTLSDVIMKRCRMVLRSVAVEDENKAFFSFMAESLLKNESCNVGHPTTVSRPLDFRTVDLRLDAGFYGLSHESFIEDVHEVWKNLRLTYRNKPRHLDSIETLSKRLEELYEQEVLTLVSNAIDYLNDSSSDEKKKELNAMLADTITSTLSVAPWEDGICKICGKDENDHILLLCDRCDGEYHTYCLDPPLQKVPKASWYCPSCISFITSQAMSQEEHSNTPEPCQAPDRKKTYKDSTQNGLEALAELADAMESKEYWELGVKERVLLLKFLCDEALSTTKIWNHTSADDFDSQRYFLGRDSTGRLYWVLGNPKRLVLSGPHSTDEVCETSREFDASEHCSWICYESDAEVEALLEWLRDDDRREKKLKKAITRWQRNKSNDDSGQADVQVNCKRLMVHSTSARAALEKKCGPFSVGAIQFLEKGGNGRVSEILQCLKHILLNIEGALPGEALRPSRTTPDRLCTWREFVKSALSIPEMVQATIILEDMIKTEHLRNEWWYWSSLSSATKISTVSSLALRIYALDAAIFYEKPPMPPEPVVPGDYESKKEASEKASSSTMVGMSETSGCENRPKKKVKNLQGWRSCKW